MNAVAAMTDRAGSGEMIAVIARRRIVLVRARAFPPGRHGAAHPEDAGNLD